MHVSHGRKGRRLTCIIYANESWRPGDGGELRLHPLGGEVIDVPPLGNRLVVFFSDARVPHEVLPSHADRYALSMWFEDCPKGES